MLLAGVIYEKLVDYDLYHLYGMVWYILIPIHAISLCQESHRMNRTQRITNPMPTSAIPKTAAVCRLRLPPAPTQPSKPGQFHLFCLTFKRCSCLPYQTTVFAVTVCAHNAQGGNIAEVFHRLFPCLAMVGHQCRKKKGCCCVG